jgi:hypothetical protein
VPHQVIATTRSVISAKSPTYRVLAGADTLSDEASQRAYSTVLVTRLTEMVLGARSAEAPSLVSSPKPVAAAPPELTTPGVAPAKLATGR